MLAAASVIKGDDLALVRADNLFTHMIDLRDALTNDDSFGMTLAGEGIDKNVESLARARSNIGSRSQQTQQMQDRSLELQVAERTLLSDLRDTEYTEAITRFLQLQQQLEATLQVGSVNLQTSLLDFLR